MTLDRLHKLSQWRGPKPRPAIFQNAVSRIQRDARRTHRHLGDFIEHWQAMLPEELAKRTSIEGVRGGTIHVRTDSAAVSFEVDRLLREGLLASLRRACSITVADVKLRVR
ncbi:MAG: DciA family protein [Planctomycetota bacterium]|nr:DciA family protein [Planctomycetota bacterium]